MKSALILLVAALAGATVATQQVSDDDCIWSCLNQALKYSKCTSADDLDCMCNSSDFQNASTDCIKSICTQSALDEAVATKNSDCVGHVKASTSTST
ncbi:hypothetical protein ASPZODRAFT_12597 [Penicilliopsis zonata CBS 506.65]|uniref:CFEM domain-containing protein n=1 Tax=Penicilliopsis zonata CBS 506.65 TaxID=1073090 RepID=A0A1L9SXH7_9EURO|nr:hypothetical protein ASPZODRAFT_12597 [Penicilliopsis zonata CBS 506.65]OJJ51791.1 hypothetical protein ASPZODRAFT_12597 [Penicilliopsis zonata CBS 506.65]